LAAIQIIEDGNTSGTAVRTSTHNTPITAPASSGEEE
jgi:hypothetical protein